MKLRTGVLSAIVAVGGLAISVSRAEAGSPAHGHAGGHSHYYGGHGHYYGQAHYGHAYHNGHAHYGHAYHNGHAHYYGCGPYYYAYAPYYPPYRYAYYPAPYYYAPHHHDGPHVSLHIGVGF